MSFTQRQAKRLFSRKQRHEETEISAKTVHEQLRCTSNERLNKIKSDIHRTFSNENRRLNYLKQLTDKIEPKYGKRIDRLCVKYSICQKPKAFKTLAEDIDLEYIAKNYIKRKSKDRKKEEEIQDMRKSVNKIANRYIKQSPYQFFNFDLETLRNMERKSKRNSNTPHPYLQVYESSQIEVFQNLAKNKCLSLGQVDEIPMLGEPDDWQKERKHIKGIYVGVKNLRVQTARQRPVYKTHQVSDTFYIT